MTSGDTAPPRRGHRRVWIFLPLPPPWPYRIRYWFHGPRWRSHFGVRERPLVEIAPEAVGYHRPGRKLLVYDLEGDIRELVTEGGVGHDPLRPGVRAEW